MKNASMIESDSIRGARSLEQYGSEETIRKYKVETAGQATNCLLGRAVHSFSIRF
jgi:hypothetical protein